MTNLQPLSDSPPDEWGGLSFVFTDIDDTITTDGRLEATVYTMIERLSDAGLKVVPVTGRPAGWCDLIARFWPVEAVVGENGAFYFRYDRPSSTMTRVFAQSSEERERNRQALVALRDKILSAVPCAAVAADQRYRETDLAIDIAEDVDRLPDHEIDMLVELFEAVGATARVSSIHVNGWFGQHDKLSMTRQLLLREFGRDPDHADDQAACTFIGDSPNDSPLFGFFSKSVGVANIRSLAARCSALPTWITTAPSGAGFCEFAEHILANRNRST
ncbi:MAG: HAD-IIB family hydrolase [Hyphomicrobiaceae bacterium]